jgi:deazaflavin-dependent oxidoreductase (nitroreductase family)
MAWFPSLILETTGRRTGITRYAALPYVRDGDAYLVVASNFGGPHPPGWLVNLQARPKVQILLRRKRFGARAEAVFPGDSSYERLWDAATRLQKKTYNRYREGTFRPIAVVRLIP